MFFRCWELVVGFRICGWLCVCVFVFGFWFLCLLVGCVLCFVYCCMVLKFFLKVLDIGIMLLNCWEISFLVSFFFLVNVLISVFLIVYLIFVGIYLLEFDIVLVKFLMVLGFLFCLLRWILRIFMCLFVLGIEIEKILLIWFWCKSLFGRLFIWLVDRMLNIGFLVFCIYVRMVLSICFDMLLLFFLEWILFKVLLILLINIM